MVKNTTKEIRPVSIVKPLALLKLSALRTLDETVKVTGETPVNYHKVKDEASETVAELNQSYIIRAYDTALLESDPVQAILRMHTAPAMNRKGDVRPVRLNLADALRYIGAHKTALSDKCDSILADLDNIVTALNAYYKASLTTDNAATKPLRTAIQGYLRHIDPSLNCKGYDMRWLVYAAFKAGKTTATYNETDIGKVGKYIQDIAYRQLTNKVYRAETEEDMKALTESSDNL